MMNSLAKLIFEQFLQIVEKLVGKKGCIKFNECDFDFRVRELVNHRLIDVIYVAEDICKRCTSVVVTIDFTNICLEDLTSCKWICYLKTLAKEFVCDICPKKLDIVKDKPKKCRPQPPKWNPFPCKHTITIIKEKEQEFEKPKCKVIVEKDCECIPMCKRIPCVPRKKIIIKNISRKRHNCSDFTILVEKKNKKHDWDSFKDHTDFNNHIWNDCCNKRNRCIECQSN